MNSDSANKFISALVKSLQTLCHGYVEFNDGIEIIGHLYLNIDSGSSFDYVVKEKVCKNAENSTVFVSKSFQAQAPPEECIIRKEKDDDQTVIFEDSSNMSLTAGTSRLQSAISSISNVLSGAPHDSHKSRLLDQSLNHPPAQSTSKRKREHNGNYNSLQPPYKYTTLQTSSYFSSTPSKHAADRNHTEHFSSPSHAEFFGGDSNQSSGMGAEDEDDLDLDVTFVKEEYESQRNSGQRGISAVAASRLSQDPSSNQSNMLHDGSTLSYSANHHQAPQQFASGTASDLGSLSQGFQDPSQVDMTHSSQGPPNPRSDASPTSREMESELHGSALDLTTSEPFKPDLVGISDTLQLGIKLFGPNFVKDVTAGNLSLSLTTSEVDENRNSSTEPINASVFPEMFEITTVSTCLKPSHKVLWHDRKDKLKRSLMMRKANLSKIRSRTSVKKVLSSDELQPLEMKCLDLVKDIAVDPVEVPLKRKRGRPPKILKMISKSDLLLKNSLVDCNNVTPSLCDEKDSNRRKNDIGTISSPDQLTPCRPFHFGEGSRRIRGSYRQYTPADKLEIVEFGIKYGSTAASRKYNIPESTVRSWTKKMDIFLLQMKMSESSESHLHKKTSDDTVVPASKEEDLVKTEENSQSVNTTETVETILILPVSAATDEFKSESTNEPLTVVNENIQISSESNLSPQN
ncbi:uncharacterized protein LOC131934879 isoform X2 [Physella acuta]|uniref:uncharacterized protein LOC131934879 isoform X2 n=1 Tax=Physella acuta TaxID=109671 RepID=UPI0027DBC69D|nr:uncharacterized protein LOC131934879 isoform X2 [Physella acuta]